MCMVEGGDYMLELIRDNMVKARKPHKCCECRRIIVRGETYRDEIGVGDGRRFEVYKTCRQCNVAKQFINLKCRGYLYTQVSEDLQEHINVPEWGFYSARLYVGMMRKWKKFKSDELMEARVYERV